MGTCRFIVDDLLQNKFWHSALEMKLSEVSVVAGREYPDSSLIIFIPLSGTVKLSDMTMQLNRVKQLALELSTGEVTIEQHPQDETVSQKSEFNQDYEPAAAVDLPTPDIFKPLLSFGRFKIDHSFDRDKCLRLHQEVLYRQFEHEYAQEASSRKRARQEEIRLGLIPDNSCSDSEQNPENLPQDFTGSVDMDDESEEETTSSSLIDIHTSVMFVFNDGPTLSYFQAAAGLAPPQFCPDDSDDEKPIDIIQQEQRKSLKKRKADD